MKKVIIFGSIIVLLFVALTVITKMEQGEKSKGNPYQKEQLHPATIDQLDDPLYGNLILPEELETKLSNQEDAFVYFYSPTCPACKEVTPSLVPLAEQLQVDLKKFNLLEFQDGWKQYNIPFTPQIIFYKDGKEFSRFPSKTQSETGYSTADIEQWFKEQQQYQDKE